MTPKLKLGDERPIETSRVNSARAVSRGHLTRGSPSSKGGSNLHLGCDAEARACSHISPVCWVGAGIRDPG